MKLGLAGITLFLLSGCMSLGQDVYNNRAMDECKQETDIDARRACETRARDEKYKKDVENRNHSE